MPVLSTNSTNRRQVALRIVDLMLFSAEELFKIAKVVTPVVIKVAAPFRAPSFTACAPTLTLPYP